MTKLDKVIQGLKCCILRSPDDKARCNNCPYEGNCVNRLKMDALELLKEQGWTLIMEDADGYLHSLPGDDGKYLMTDGKDIWIDDYVDGVDDGIWLDSGRDIREIKAWMYMPKLPKEGR